MSICRDSLLFLILALGMATVGKAAESRPDILTLPDTIAQIETAAAGRFLVIRFTQADGLAVYDTTSGTLSRTVPFANDGVFAAGGERAVIFNPGSELLQVFDVTTGRKILSGRNPFPGRIAALRMGSQDDQRACAIIRLEKGHSWRIGMLDLATLQVSGVLADFYAGSDDKHFPYISASRSGSVILDHRSKAACWRFEPAGFVSHPIEALESHGHPYVLESNAGLLYIGGAIVGRNQKVREQKQEHLYLPDAGGSIALRISLKGELTLTSATGNNDLLNLGQLEDWPAKQLSMYHFDKQTANIPLSKRLQMDVLNDRLLWIPFDDRRIIRRTLKINEQLTALGKPYLIPMSATLPPAQAGTLWSHQLAFLASSKTCSISAEIVPEGMKVSTEGRLSWEIPADASGTHDLLLSFQGENGKVAMLDLALIIEPPRGRAAPVAQDPTGEFILRSSWTYAPAHDGNQAYLARDTRIDVLDRDLQRSLGFIEVERIYQKLIDRPDYLIGLGERGVDLIDKRTGKTIKQIPIRGKIWSIIASPTTRQCYAVGDNEMPESHTGKFERQRLWRIDETAGTATLLTDAFGHQIAIHPSGTALYSVVFGRQPHLLPGIDRFGNEYLATENKDFVWLLAYQIEDQRLMLRSIQQTPGSWDGSIIISPDGKEVAFASSRGFRVDNIRWVLPVFDAGNLTRLERGYQDNYSAPRTLSYHGLLDFVLTDNSLRQRQTGDSLPALLRIKDARDQLLAPHAIRSWFSPGGRHVAIACGDVNNRSAERLIRVLPLTLRPEDETRLRDTGKPAVPPPVFTAGDQIAGNAQLPGKPLTQDAKPVTAAMMPGSTRKPSAVKMSPADLAKKYKNAVITVRHRNGFGTGMFIGDGLILTCAHVIPAIGSPTSVDYIVEKDGKTTTLIAEQVVVRRLDVKNDLALIQIVPTAPVTQVTLSDVQPRTGESVCVIGSPGLGAMSLDHTLTTGIISTPERQLDGLPFIQTSAAVNPGNSGGPLFDDRGSVIGVIVLKAHIEAVGFAVPMQTIRTFLAAAQR